MKVYDKFKLTGFFDEALSVIVNLGGIPLRKYETTFIVDSLIKIDEIEGIIGKIEKFISNNGGQIEEINRIGKKRLAYEIKKRQYGFIVSIYYQAQNKLNRLLEREYQLDENILRYLTILIEPKAEKALQKIREAAAAKKTTPIRKVAPAEVKTEAKAEVKADAEVKAEAAPAEEAAPAKDAVATEAVPVAEEAAPASEEAAPAKDAAATEAAPEAEEAAPATEEVTPEVVAEKANEKKAE